MELIDTPNPNAKKVETDLSLLNQDNLEATQALLSRDLYKIKGVSSIFLVLIL